MSSAVGAPIPIVYGTYAVAGNVVWSSGLIEKVKRKRQGGNQVTHLRSHSSSLPGIAAFARQ
jgi:hypothetical protein